MDTRTLIFCIALLNLSFALMVWSYTRTLRSEDPCIRLWQHAKLVCGTGYLLGWLRPLLPEAVMPLAQVGNAMQIVGIGMEFMAYLAFFGL